MSIFKAADKDNSGILTIKEFQDVIDDVIVRYPQVELYLKSKHMLDVTDLLKDPQGKDRKEIDLEGLKLALGHVDSQMKSLPATAQVCIILPITKQLHLLTPFAFKYRNGIWELRLPCTGM